MSGQRTPGRSWGLREEGDVFKVTWANLELGPLGNRGGRREEGEDKEGEEQGGREPAGGGGQGQPAFLHQALKPPKPAGL